jgi:hypothetical protein
VLVRLNVEGAETASDHDLHMIGLMLPGRPKTGAKALQKALDRRHQASIGKFAKAKTPEAVSALWKDALKAGDIPGAYRALLTHPVATDTIISHAFGDVHMLSHLLGAANRADIRRLRELEAENTALATKIERQQRQLRDGSAPATRPSDDSMSCSAIAPNSCARRRMLLKSKDNLCCDNCSPMCGPRRDNGRASASLGPSSPPFRCGTCRMQGSTSAFRLSVSAPHAPIQSRSLWAR